jgi:hypothetical protein
MFLHTQAHTHSHSFDLAYIPTEHVHEAAMLCLPPIFRLDYCSAHSSTLKMVGTCSSETPIDFQLTTLPQKIELFIKTAVRTSNPMAMAFYSGRTQLWVIRTEGYCSSSLWAKSRDGKCKYASFTFLIYSPSWSWLDSM